MAAGAHHAGVTLQDEVVGRAFGQRPALPKTRDRAVHQLGVALGQALVVQPIARHGAHLVVLDEHVALLGQLAHHRLPFGLGDVQRDGFLAAVVGQKTRRVVGIHLSALRVLHAVEGADAARVIALARLLHLDDGGAHVGQVLGAHGPGDHTGQVEHGDARKNAAHGVCSCCAGAATGRLRRALCLASMRQILGTRRISRSHAGHWAEPASGNWRNTMVMYSMLASRFLWDSGRYPIRRSAPCACARAR